MQNDNSTTLFKKFADEYFEEYLKLYPNAGSYLGLHQYDGEINDISKKGIENEIKVLKLLYKKLQSIEQAKLSAENKYDYDIARWSLESSLFDIEEFQSYKKNPMYYAFMFSEFDNYVSRDYAPFDERLKGIINIMDKIPAALKHAEENLSATLPEVLCKYARRFSLGYEDFFQNELMNFIKEKTHNDKLISHYNSKSKSAINAFKKFVELLDKRSSSSDESFRLGRDLFRKMLRIKEHIDLPIEEIKWLGLEELTRLQNELKKILTENNFEGKLDKLEHDHPSESSLISDTKNTLQELVDFIRNKDLIDLPEKLNCIVTEMPKYMNFGFAAMNTAGPFEKSNESFYYINVPEKDWDEKKKDEWLTQFNYPSLILTSIHEAYPGHYTHFLNANTNSTKLSKLFMSYSYVEGWAHYTEEMMLEQGYGKENFKIKIGQLLEALIRCSRYLVAIGIHCESMSVQEAKNFFLKNAYMTETTALQEAERGTFDPGYLNYTLGKIFLKKFREKYFAKFNNSKLLKDFHNTVVSLGAPTFTIAEKHILDQMN